MRSHHQPGEIIANKYKIIGILGEGNSGITYEAKLNDRLIALKALSLQSMTDWKLIELFEREAVILAKVSHPAIPSYIDYFQVDTVDNRAFYIAQELAEGKSLAALVAGGWHKREEEVKAIAIALLKILVYLHLQKPTVIHRDIKPQNIIRRDDGKIFLVDFGAVGHTYHNTMMRGSTVVGTYGYMAPEQFRGRAFPATDLYGLGATLLFLLTHRSPAELPNDGLRIDFRRYVRVSEEFGDWLEKLLEPDMSERFPNAAAALNALQPKKISITKSVSWKAMALAMGLGIGAIAGGQFLNNNKYGVFNRLGLTPQIHSAIESDLIELPDYLAKGGDINGKDRFGRTLLHNAVARNQIDLVEFLIDRGADVNRLDRNGNTALYKAVYDEKKQLITLLKSHQAALNTEDLAKLEPKLHEQLCRPWQLAFLLNEGVNVNAKDQSGLSPILKLVNGECRDGRNVQIDIAKLLIYAGADVNTSDPNGRTPLHFIYIKYKRYDAAIAKLLIDAGANLNAQDNKGQTPLHTAIGKSYSSPTVEFLIEAGANLNIRDNKGQTPLHLAGTRNNRINGLEKLLVEAGADPHITDNTGKPTPYALTKEKWQQRTLQRELEQQRRLERWQQKRRSTRRRYKTRRPFNY